MRTFYNYLIEKEDYEIKNVWKKVKLKSEKGTDESISTEDFYGLLEVINEIDSFDQIGKTRRNMYKPWIIDLIKLKVYGQKERRTFCNEVEYDSLRRWKAGLHQKSLHQNQQTAKQL